MQALEIDSLFEIDLADPGGLERAVPAVAGVEIGIDRYGFGVFDFAGHRLPSLLDDAGRLGDK